MQLPDQVSRGVFDYHEPRVRALGHERLGVCRLCVIHRNVPNMINSVLDLISARNINIEHMINKPRGGYAYTMIDLAERVNGEITSQILQNPDVLRVRVI